MTAGRAAGAGTRLSLAGGADLPAVGEEDERQGPHPSAQAAWDAWHATAA